MEELYGLAALIAWNPGLAYGLVCATALLRLHRVQLPAYLTLVAVGAAVGLSHGVLVQPPPTCRPLDPFATLAWFGLLTFVAEWRAAGMHTPNMPQFKQTLAVLRETLLSLLLFLAAVWRPALAGWLAGLLLGYGLCVLLLRANRGLRRLRVRRRLRRAAAVGSRRAQRILARPAEPTLEGAARRRRIGFGIATMGFLLVGAWCCNVAPERNLYDSALTCVATDISLRANALEPAGPESVGFQLATEAECLRHITQIPYLWWRLHCAVSQAEFGVDPYAARHGYFMYSYISPVDDSPQSYAVWVPASPAPDTPLPLVVWLHGHIGFQPWKGMWIPTELWTDQAIVIAPQARGSLDYTGLQKNEVRRAMDDVQARYRIDRDRIYLAGHSMGGTGAWYLATQWPDEIAAIAPSSPNLSPWAWGYCEPSGSPAHDNLAARLQLQEAALGGVMRLAHMPFLASHSDDDGVVPVENSRQMTDMLRFLHHESCTICQPPPSPTPDSGPQYYHESQNQGIGHGVSILPDRRLEWLLQFRRQPTAARNYPPPVPAYGPIYRAFDEPFVLVIPDDCPRWAQATIATDRELALQQVAREVIAFRKFWTDRYQHAPRIMSATGYLTRDLPDKAGWHPILLGGPDINLATAMLVEGDGPMAAWRLPVGFDVREDHLTCAGQTTTQPAVLFTIAPPALREHLPEGTSPPPFAVVISASHGAAYFQCLRRYGIQFGSFALHNRIWFDYALCDTLSHDNTRLIARYGFFPKNDFAWQVDWPTDFTGSFGARAGTPGSLWPAAALVVPHPPPIAAALTQPATVRLYEQLPLQVDSERPLTFNAHALGQPLHLGGDPLNNLAGARLCLRGVSTGALGAVTGPARADWPVPPGRWRLRGTVGSDFVVYPPLVFAALDSLHLPGPPRQPPAAAFRVRVNEKEVWISAKPPKPPQPVPALTPRPDPASLPPLPLEYELNIELPAGTVLSLETVPLRGRPWELPPTVWADIRLERID